MIRFCAPLIAALAALTAAPSGAEERTLVIRERTTATLLDGAFSIKVWKIQGYSIDVRINGEKQLLRIGQSVSPDGADCTVRFKKISPETRIARFTTDCPESALRSD